MTHFYAVVGSMFAVHNGLSRHNPLTEPVEGYGNMELTVVNYPVDARIELHPTFIRITFPACLAFLCGAPSVTTRSLGRRRVLAI